VFSRGTTHFTYTDLNNIYIYNVNELLGISNTLGSGIVAAARGSFNYLQASGGTYIRPTTPSNQ
jgi:hypothetical protein